MVTFTALNVCIFPIAGHLLSKRIQILDNWLRGRKRAIWFSCSADLLHDARRDLQELGAGFIPVEDLSKMTYNKIDSGPADKNFDEVSAFPDIEQHIISHLFQS